MESGDAEQRTMRIAENETLRIDMKSTIDGFGFMGSVNLENDLNPYEFILFLIIRAVSEVGLLDWCDAVRLLS
jgi:hypothetical protein